MRFLVDTHIVLWWLRGDTRISDRVGEIMTASQSRLLWSLASSWKVAVKISIGKLELDRPIHRFFADLIDEQQMELLPISNPHCERAATLPLHHRDPFDRMLVAQALVEDTPVLTADPKLALYGIDTIG